MRDKKHGAVAEFARIRAICELLGALPACWPMPLAPHGGHAAKA